MTRRAILVRAAPLALVLLLAAASLAPFDDVLRLESGDDSRVERWAAAVEALPEDADVLVAFDPDLGTYAEIRPTVRVILADLLARQSRLALVSLTPEGRALSLAELDRLTRSNANRPRIADLGFLPGAEAALVRLTRFLPDAVDGGSLGQRLVDEGIATFDAILVVGGNDLTPRSWVEQVAPRIGDVPMLAVAPTALAPELLPYEGSGQLDALLVTPRHGAAYRASVELGTYAQLAPDDSPPAAAILAGLIVAVLVLGQALVSTVARPGRTTEREAE